MGGLEFGMKIGWGVIMGIGEVMDNQNILYKYINENFTE